VTFDALTVAGILSAALCGGFVFAMATGETPREPGHRQSSPTTRATGARRRRRAVRARRGRREIVGRRTRPFR
jgi:hypothetical protein